MIFTAKHHLEDLQRQRLRADKVEHHRNMKFILGVLLQVAMEIDMLSTQPKTPCPPQRAESITLEQQETPCVT